MTLYTDLVSVGEVEYTAHLCHYFGNLAMPCATNDTFRLKVPDYAPNTYIFNCELNLNHEIALPFDSGCTEYSWTNSIQIPITDPLSISEMDRSVFQLYPNPTRNGTIVTAASQKMKEVILTDMSGRQLGRFRANGTKEMELDVSNYSNGLYLVEVVLDDGRRGSQRLVVQH
jgi:hypothetical protein